MMPESISGFLNIYSLISLSIGLVTGPLFTYKLIYFFFKREIRLFKNLRRIVYLLDTGQTPLQREKTLLQQNGLFRVKDEVFSLSDLGLLETLEKYSVFVIGYSTNFLHYQKIIDRAKRDLIPVVFLAGPRDITDEHMTIFKDYPYFEMCNTSSRLLTTIFNLSVITPNDKRRV